MNERGRGVVVVVDVPASSLGCFLVAGCDFAWRLNAFRLQHVMITSGSEWHRFRRDLSHVELAVMLRRSYL